MTDISMQHLNPEQPEPSHWFRGGPPGDDLPLSTAIYKAAQNYGKNSQTVSEAMYTALVQLEAQVVALRSEGGK